VEKIELYYTTIYTPDRQKLVIPNSTLTGKSVVNSGLTNGDKLLSITIGISYEENVQRVLKILEQLMDEEPRIQKEKRRTFVEEFGESSIVVGMRGLVSIRDYMDVRWDMQEKIRQRFLEEHVEIPYNQLDVHVIRD
jgi:small conductance mechanosensitive channel